MKNRLDDVALGPMGIAGAIALLMVLANFSAAATYTEQKRDLSRVNVLLRTAERHASSDRTDDVIAAFNEAHELLKGLAGDLEPRLQRSYDRARKSLEESHQELTAAGLKLPPVGNLDAKSAEPSLGPRPERRAGSDRVSFVDEIAPIFLAKCNTCHVGGAKGGLSLGTYNGLMQGARSGDVVVKGSGFESRIADVIAGGEMPPQGKGEKVTPQQAQRLVKWINQGATFDGDNPDKPLDQLVNTESGDTPAPESKPPAMAEIPLATGDETVSFAKDIAPLLTESCVGCHGADRPAAMLSVASFESLWNGGDSGPVVAPGDSEDSLLMQKLLGTAAEGARMPRDRPPLSDDKIALFAKWIAEGARFDGDDPTLAIARVAALARAGSATSEELSAFRQAEAAQTWRLAIPDEQAAQVPSERFLVVGNLPESQLEQLAKLAESEASRVLEFFRTAEPLNKSRITLFAFAKRIDYSEFAKMVERRDLAREQLGHAMYDFVNPYAAMSYDRDDEQSMRRLLATEIAALWVADQAPGRLPDWFVEGGGRAVAARLWPQDAEVERWQNELPAAIAGLRDADDMLTGKLPPGPAELLSFGFVDGILRKQGNFNRLVAEVAGGKDFAAATMAVYRRSPKQLAELWVASERR